MMSEAKHPADVVSWVLINNESIDRKPETVRRIMTQLCKLYHRINLLSNSIRLGVRNRGMSICISRPIELCGRVFKLFHA